MTRILLLSFYFRPDLSAGSFRASALADALLAEGDDNLEIDVLTTSPNRYHSFTATAAEDEREGRLRIRRLKIPPHRSGMVDQARAFSSFARQVMRATRGQIYDVVFATTSRLMTGALGAAVAKRTNAALYLDVRDLFIDTMQDLFAKRSLRHVLPVFRGLERWTFRSAAKINLVSPGFEPYLQSLVPGTHCSRFTNGIDQEFLGTEYVRATPRARPLIVYAGNIGQGQGLHRVIPEAALILKDTADFLVIGDGGAKAELERALVDKQVHNVTLIPPVERSRLHDHYLDADVLLLHLNDHAAFRKVLPSKLFEYAATGNPILAGVAGYARDFIEEHVERAALFEPCDSRGLVRALASLNLRHGPRLDFVRQFSRPLIMASMARDILSLSSSHTATTASEGRQSRLGESS